MLITILYFIIGLFLLLFATEIFVKMAQKISLAFCISPFIVGVTIVAVGTSLPELSVSLIAALKKDTGLALGNIIGSNITNIFLVLPVGILLGKIRVGTIKTQRNSFLLLLSTLLFISVMTAFHFPPMAGLLLLISAALFTGGEYFWGIAGRNIEDKQRFSFQDTVMFLISLVGILLGGTMLVNSVESISTYTGITTTVLGLSLTAIATSMPELLTTIFSLRKKEDKMTLGNIIGSNIYNLLLIGGIIALSTPIVFIPGSDWIILLIATISLASVIFIYKGKLIPKKFGLIFLLFFFVYIWSLYLKNSIL